ncbi:MAG: hypothetical protein K6E40_02955 [Desulfovibrio sp.]|nr:hypothetical protein [Desulfovibrio sp.]
METSYASWSREHLAMAVDSYLALLESQKSGGTLTPEAVLRAVATRTGRSQEDARRILNTVTWQMSMHNAPVCKGFRALCETDEKVLAMLEQILSRDRKIDRFLHRKPWSRSDLKAAVACYRAMYRDQQAGVPFDRTERLSKLAEDLSRKFSAVRLRMNNISWIMSQHDLPVVDCIPMLAGVGRKVVTVVLDIYDELEAGENESARQDLWTEEQLRSALDAYRDIVRLEASKARFDVSDSICALAQETGRRFSYCRLRLANIAWLLQERGRKPIASIAPSESMPEETKLVLTRLLDAGRHA